MSRLPKQYNQMAMKRKGNGCFYPERDGNRIVYDNTSACLELFTTISISQIEFSYCA
jgi:hypothetical protein